MLSWPLKVSVSSLAKWCGILTCSTWHTELLSKACGMNPCRRAEFPGWEPLSRGVRMTHSNHSWFFPSLPKEQCSASPLGPFGLGGCEENLNNAGCVVSMCWPKEFRISHRAKISKTCHCLTIRMRLSKHGAILGPGVKYRTTSYIWISDKQQVIF